MMDEKISRLKRNAIENIDENEYGALSYELRNQILSCFNNREKYFIILNTLLLNYPIWHKTFPKDFTFDEIVQYSHKYINNQIEQDLFSKLISDKYVYILNRINEGKTKAGYSALALLRLCREEITNEFKSDDELRGNSDPEEWSSLFIGSLTYSNGEEDINNINGDLNKRYWNYFLECLEKKKKIDCTLNQTSKDNSGRIEVKMYEYPYRPTPNHNSSGTEVKTERQQVILSDKDEKVFASIEKIINFYMNLKKEKQWNELKINCYAVNDFISITGENDSGKINNTELYIINSKIKASKIFKDIRKDMYSINPFEGAWYKMRVSIDSTDTAFYFFTYDIKDPFFEKYTDVSDFKNDLLKFPRSEEYTPNWLKDIVIEIE
ncbi:MAG: immunity protein Imm5 [Campylobacteraceae bacterium]|jgi:hypothetical protein|nr:immunity protein Imm5 [Campylobacteraceae bacterium]